jgi:hypothetical protein
MHFIMLENSIKSHTGNDMKAICAFLSILVCVYCAGSNRIKKEAEDVLPQYASGNFILYVSNQSFAISPVDIHIHIDGKHAVESEFVVSDQHNWIIHTFRLSPGKHQLVARSLKGGANIEKSFTIEDGKIAFKKYWAVIDYWYYPRQTGGAGPTSKEFSCIISDKPVTFD